jgi:hypothetical protein
MLSGKRTQHHFDVVANISDPSIGHARWRFDASAWNTSIAPLGVARFALLPLAADVANVHRESGAFHNAIIPHRFSANAGKGYF